MTVSTLSLALDSFFLELARKLDAKKTKAFERRDWRSLGIALAKAPETLFKSAKPIRLAYRGERLLDLIRGANLRAVKALIKGKETIAHYIPHQLRVRKKYQSYPHLEAALEEVRQYSNPKRKLSNEEKFFRALVQKTKLEHGVASFESLVVKAALKFNQTCLQALFDRTQETEGEHWLAQVAYKTIFSQEGLSKIYAANFRSGLNFIHGALFPTLKFLIKDCKVKPGIALANVSEEIEEIRKRLSWHEDGRFDDELKALFY